MQNALLSRIGSIVSELKSTQTKNIGGCKLKEVTEFIVSPKGLFDKSVVVTIDTPVAHKPDAVLNVDSSIF
tara:strand:+ start:244 stop:456 length:213 start_codon:yes stop_codon:yes gene_type:complete